MRIIALPFRTGQREQLHFEHDRRLLGVYLDAFEHLLLPLHIDRERRHCLDRATPFSVTRDAVAVSDEQAASFDALSDRLRQVNCR